MQAFLLVKLPEFVFDILNRRIRFHAIHLLASAAEKRARLRNSAAFWQPSCRVVTFRSIVTSMMTFFSTCAEI